MGSKEKKRYKKSTQSRKKKRDRDSKKRNVKKLRRDEYSYSESDDESMSLVSLSSYSSEEGFKGRRSRSHAKKGVKGRKKRSNSSSSSSDSSIDSMQVKKRKSSKRKVSLVRKKKDGKKYKRVVSLSSTSSKESDYEKSRRELKKKGKRGRHDKEDKSMRKNKRSKARSISPSSESSASDNERKRKRYRSPSRSLLSMSNEREREGKRKRYWSPSGSSLSRGSESSDQQSQAEFEVQNKPVKKLNSVIVVADTVESGENAMIEGLNNDLQMMDDERTMKSSIVQKDENAEEVKSVAEATLVPDSEDLESILRRKALENLKRFRGPKTSEKSEQTEKMEMSITGVKQLPNSENAADKENTGGSSMKHSLSLEILPIHNEADKDQIIRVSLVSSSDEGVLASPYVDNKNTSSKNNVETRTEDAKFSERTDDNRKMTPKPENLNPSPITVKKSIIGDDSISKRKPGKSSNVKAESNSLHICQKPLSACSAGKSSESQVDEVNPKSDNNIIKESNTLSACVSDNPSSSPPTNMAADLLSSDQQIENKEESQFQEKTMSVMRGGELVQVSYKVYIPKKAPAANRRRLKR